MKIFDKSMKLEHVAYDIRGPVLEEADRMRANGEKILRLNTGNPAAFGFEAPDEVIRDLITNARESEGYSDSKGIFQPVRLLCSITSYKTSMLTWMIYTLLMVLVRESLCQCKLCLIMMTRF